MSVVIFQSEPFPDVCQVFRLFVDTFRKLQSHGGCSSSLRALTAYRGCFIVFRSVGCPGRQGQRARPPFRQRLPGLSFDQRLQRLHAALGERR